MKYRKKPVEIEAVKWNGENVEEVLGFTEQAEVVSEIRLVETAGTSTLEIDTLEGTMTASVGDYIIKGIQGEFYPCKPDIFVETYEKV